MSHTLQEVIDLAVKTAVLKAHPVGSYWITETDDDPNIIFGGGVWERIQGKFLQCSDDTHPAGTDIDAGLPDIHGEIHVVGNQESCRWACNVICGGAFQTYPIVSGKQAYAQCTINSLSDTNRADFDASRYNAIYGNSNTVQPPAHVVNVWKRTA